MKPGEDRSPEAAARTEAARAAGERVNYRGACVVCCRDFDGGAVVACCDHHTEYGEEWGADGRRVPFVQHLDGACAQCCGCPGATRRRAANVDPAEVARLAEDPSLAIFDHAAVAPADRAKLLASGYRPVLRWAHANTICTTGEALKNIEIEAKRAKCAHVRNGASDFCRYCGQIMPWGKQ